MLIFGFCGNWGEILDKVKIVFEDGFVKTVYKKMIRVSLFFLVLSGLMLGQQVAWAEPQFGGVVEEYIYCNCTNNYFLKVGDPHGGEFIQNNATNLKDCQPPTVGQWVLGMHTEWWERCEIRVHGACVLHGIGKTIEYYGASKSGGCETGLDGDAAGEGKEEMITPDGRTADGGDYDDGGPSGGPSQARRHDTHLATVDGVKADGSGGAEHMITPDHQDYEGNNTNHMETADGRNYEGENDEPLRHSGNGSGYSPAGGGKKAYGNGSIGGSVGSGGLQSPAILDSVGSNSGQTTSGGSGGGSGSGNNQNNQSSPTVFGKRDVRKEVAVKNETSKKKIIKEMGEQTEQSQKKRTAGGTATSLLFAGGAGYFILKSIKSLFI